MKLNTPIFNSESKDFDASISIEGKIHNLTICDFSIEEEIKAANLAERIYKWLEINLNASKIYAASILTELKNDAWLDENEMPITHAKFVDTITFDEIIAFSEEVSKFFLTTMTFFGDIL